MVFVAMYRTYVRLFGFVAALIPFPPSLQKERDKECKETDSEKRTFLLRDWKGCAGISKPREEQCSHLIWKQIREFVLEKRVLLAFKNIVHLINGSITWLSPLLRNCISFCMSSNSRLCIFKSKVEITLLLPCLNNSDY